MAKKWFTSFPDVYYMKQLRKGGRNELVFTFLGILKKKKGILFLERYLFSPLI